MSITNPVFTRNMRPFVRDLANSLQVSETGHRVGIFQFARQQRDQPPYGIPFGSINEPDKVLNKSAKNINFQNIYLKSCNVQYRSF
jgi:hypothetical protein